MKIGIITFHRADNFGALLQAYALQEKLCEDGHDAEIIDYRCYLLEKDYIWLYRPFPKPSRNIKRWIKEFIHRLPCLPLLKIKRDKCNTFRKKYLKLTKSVSSEFDKRNIEESFDIILTGSDQIWNWALTHGADTWYAYKRIYPQEICTIASYGASIGNLDRFKNHIEEYLPALIQYDYISTRENNSNEFLEHCLKKKVYNVIDPTLLVKSTVWKKLAETIKLKTINKPYILLYGVIHNENACKIALKLSKETKMPLVHFEQELNKISNTIYMQDIGPDDLIKYIENADYVITSSFHGTVFSIMLQKKFITVPTPMNDPRVCSLLGSLNLNERIIQNIENYDIKKIDATINYLEVNNLLNQLRADSGNYLQMCISLAEKRRKTKE